MATSLERAIKSVLAQSYSKWEMIIVDNCSEDHPELIVEKFSDDKRIRLLSIDEKDRSKARNYGIQSASGDYITFLDADDTLQEDYLKAYVEIFQKSSNVIAISDLILIKGNEKSNWSKSKHSGLHKMEYCINHGNMAFAAPASLFLDYRFEGQTGEDRHLLARASGQYDLLFTSMPYYNYVDYVKIESKEQFVEGKNANILSLRSIYKSLGDNYARNYPYDHALFELLISSFYVAMALGYKEESRKIIRSELPRPFSLRSFLKYIKAVVFYIFK